MTASCSLHAGVEATGACSRCGRFVCGACSDVVRDGWCVTCASRPAARLETSPHARATLTLSLLGVALPVLSVVAWRRSTRAGPISEADAPLLQGARWLAIATLIGWVIATSAWLLQNPA
ncbi:MAG: hypothetical protein ABTQ32_08690 [Myxococcaceae bacterium]